MKEGTVSPITAQTKRTHKRPALKSPSWTSPVLLPDTYHLRSSLYHSSGNGDAHLALGWETKRVTSAGNAS